MDIKLYTLLILTIYIVKSSTNAPQFHITDYILSYSTYHFEWNPTHFISKTLPNNKIQSCTKNTQNIPQICIQYTPQKHGFIIQYKNQSFNFQNDNAFTQINYIHSNNSIIYNTQYTHEYTQHDSYDNNDNNEISPFQSPNPNARRLLKRARCRVYLYSRKSFSGRKGGTFRRRRYRKKDLRKRGFRSGGVKSVKVRGSRCCTAKLYARDNYRGKRTRFRYGSYSRIRKRKHQVRTLGSMKVYCSRSKRRRKRRRRRRSSRGRGRKCGCNKCPCGGGSGGGIEESKKPIPILLGPMTGMLGHFGYSMHPVMPPHIAHMAGMNGNYGSGQGMPMMNHPMYGQPQMGSGYGIPPGQMMGMGMGGMGGGAMGGMGGMGAMGGMGGMGGMRGMGMGGMMGGMGGMAGQGGQPGGKTPVVHVYTDGAGEETYDDGGGYEEAGQRRLVNKEKKQTQLVHNDFFSGAAIRKCVILKNEEICSTFYFSDRIITIDYTVGLKTLLRIDNEGYDENNNNNDDMIDIEFDDSEDSNDNDYDEMMEVVMDVDDDFSDIMIEHEDYEIMRNEKLFGFESMEYDEYDIDYVNTAVWMWKKHECNNDILSFMNMSICTMGSVDDDMNKDIVIYNKYNQGIKHDEVMDVNEVRFNVRNIMDWDEIYNINMFNRINKKLCKMESIIKICVEMDEKMYVNGDINEMQISIEFL